MPRVRFTTGVEQIQGTLYDVVFKLSPQGNPIITKRPDMSNVEWSKAQIDHRQRFGLANTSARAALADPDVRGIYEEKAAKEGKRPFYIARADYLKGNNLLTEN